MSVNAVTIRRLNKVVAHEAKKPATHEEYVAFIHNSIALGYAYNSETADALKKVSVGTLTRLYRILKENKGAQYLYKPFYPNFPKQVKDISDIELYVNAIVHYFGDAIGVRVMPTYEVQDRPKLKEGTTVTVLGKASENDVQALFDTILTQGRPYSEQDKEDLTSLRHVVTIKPLKISVKENLIWATLNFTDTDFSDQYKTVTDVLRLATVLSGGDATLAENTRFKLDRFSRRIVLSLLDMVLANGASVEDFARYEEKWKRLATILHANEFHYSNAAKALDLIQRGEIQSFDSLIEELLTAEESAENFDLLMSLLKRFPGSFARRLNHVMRKYEARRSEVIENFSEVAGKVSVPVLAQLFEYFSGPDQTIVSKRPVTFKNGKTTLIPNTHKGEYADVLDTVLEALATKNTGQKVFIESVAGSYTLPLNTRNASKGQKVIGVGSRISLNSKKNVVRLFVHWHDLYEAGYSSRVDLDLSAFFAGETFNKTQQIGYYNLRDCFAWHSGDVTSAPDGASEFIDVDIKAALEAGYRYLVPSIHSFTRQPLNTIPEVLAGFMLRDEPQSGEVYEPSTVETAYAPISGNRNNVPFVFDLQTRELIWFDSSIPGGGINLASQSGYFRSVLMMLVNTSPLRVETFLNKVSDVVYSRDEADVVVDPSNADDVLQFVK